MRFGDSVPVRKLEFAVLSTPNGTGISGLRGEICGSRITGDMSVFWEPGYRPGQRGNFAWPMLISWKC